MLKLNIKGTNFKLTPEIYAYIGEKIGNLDKFIEKPDPTVQAWVEIGISTKHHQTGNIYRAEVQIRLPKKGVRAEAYAKDIFMAIDAVRDEAQEELKKYKEKQEAVYKRGARALKRIYRFSRFSISKVSRLARFWKRGKMK